jgi:lactate 2-monooxygenase
VTSFGERQRAIYRAGVEGVVPSLPMSYDALESAAREIMSPRAYDYVAGGAGAGSTMRANIDAFERWRLDPRMLREVAERDLTTEVLGTRLSAPVLTAPVGALSVIREGGELAVAQAAAELGIGMVASTMTSVPLEQIAAAGGDGPQWFQLYWPTNRELALSLVQRAAAAGYTAVVVTVDTWTLAWRPRDLAHGHLPFLTGAGLANYFTDPVFRDLLPEPPEASAQAARAAVLTWADLFGNGALTWDDIAWMVEQSPIPLLVKGIGHGADARAAVDAGAAGVIVSNHGGRQLDNAKAALDGLLDVVAAVRGRTTVLFDSGVRTAAHVLVALSLGAHAVLVGRPWIWGLALDGQDGVTHVLANLLAELDIDLGLLGYRTPDQLGPDALVRVP